MRAANDSDDVQVVRNADALDDAEYIVLPGQGAFADCMAGLEAIPGMRQKLEDRVVGAGVPYLGICVGMQMMMSVSHEHGEHKGLGWIDGDVVAIEPKDPSYKIPHMGWNELHIAQHGHPFFAGIEPEDHVYFVHSYHAVAKENKHVLATTEYGDFLTAAIGRDNMVGTQFHPEKSHHVGEQLLKNFLSMS